MCKKCKTVYANHATVCYKCGKPLSNKIYTDEQSNGYAENQQHGKKHPILISVIVIFTFFAIFSYYGSSDSSSTNPANQASQPNPQNPQQAEPVSQPIDQSAAAQFEWHNDDFGVNMESAKKEYSFISVTGKLKAINDKSYSYVQIEFGLYDQNGNKVGTASDNISNLGSGVTWQFDAVGSTSADNVKCVLEEVSGR
jgi:hypothetical protein